MMTAAEFGRTHGEIAERWRRFAEESVTEFAAGRSGFCVNLLPAEAVALSDDRVLDILRRRYGSAVDKAISREATESPGAVGPSAAPDLRSAADTDSGSAGVVGVPGPHHDKADAHWLQTSNVVGVNVRTVGSFINVVKYALTLSDAHDAIHLLPIWEPGVVGSLYGMSSWKINDEFFSPALAATHPHLDTPDRQLKATVNLLHVMGKAVGMDVIPHTDRFSEIVLAHPHHFEWIRREDLSIVDHRSDLHEEVQELVIDFLRTHGSADPEIPVPRDGASLFAAEFDEAERDRLLFGHPSARAARETRRGALARSIYLLGYEPAPATMAPPYRGLEVDRDTAHVDDDGHVWREYRITRPESMSRVFGPLTRYKLYERRHDNRDWEIDFSQPRRETWRYVEERYREVQRRFGFDFMRGDMSHVQMRPLGVPDQTDHYYDILGAVREAIAERSHAPWFGYFAETFMAPPNIMAYGDEVDHLEASGAGVTLGDLQSVPVESTDFLQRLRRYRDVAVTRTVKPAFTTMTADKDDPRFDEFYVAGNEARYFLALFLTDMPSYTGLNFECRDPHYEPAPNEQYSKLYVFHETDGPKAVSGPFQFGRNGYLFFRLSRIRRFAERMLSQWRGAAVRWLLPPDATGTTRAVAWQILTTDGAPQPVCVVNTDPYHPQSNVHIPLPAAGGVSIEGGAAGASRAASGALSAAGQSSEAGVVEAGPREPGRVAAGQSSENGQSPGAGLPAATVVFSTDEQRRQSADRTRSAGGPRAGSPGAGGSSAADRSGGGRIAGDPTAGSPREPAPEDQELVVSRRSGRSTWLTVRQLGPGESIVITLSGEVVAAEDAATLASERKP